MINLELKDDSNVFIVQCIEDERALRKIASHTKIVTVTRTIQRQKQHCDVYPENIRERFKAFGFCGFLGEFIRCSDILWTYLVTFKASMLKTLFAKTADKKDIKDSHLDLICPGNPEVGLLRVKTGS